MVFVCFCNALLFVFVYKPYAELMCMRARKINASVLLFNIELTYFYV